MISPGRRREPGDEEVSNRRRLVEPIADELAASYKRITYRRRGYQGTPAHPDCTMAKVATDAVALLDHLGITTAHIGGHSYGGLAARLYREKTGN